MITTPVDERPAGDGLADAPTLIDALRLLCSTESDRPVYVVGRRESEEVITRGGLGRMVGAQAELLRSHGVGPGQPVVVALPTGRDFVAAFWGCVAIGAVPVPLAPVRRRLQNGAERRSASSERLEAVFEVLGPDISGVFCPKTLAALDHIDPRFDVQALPIAAEPTEARLDDVLWAGVTPDATAIIQFTSGSTGSPKGCVLSHRAVTANLRSVRERLDIFHAMYGVNWAPLFHDMGLIGGLVLPVWVRMLTNVLMRPEDFAVDPRGWFEAMGRFGAEISSAPSSAFALVGRAMQRRPPDVDLACVRNIFNGAEPVDAAGAANLAASLTGTGFRSAAIHPAYGLAETVVIAASRPGGAASLWIDRGQLDAPGELVVESQPSNEQDAIRVVSLGAPVTGTSIRVVGDDGCDVGDQALGTVEIASASLFDGYLGMTPAESGLRDGWFRTHDRGFIHAGELYLIGRDDDTIIVAGKNYVASEVEQVVSELEAVHRAGVVALAQPFDGVSCLLLVVESRAREEAELRRTIASECNDRLGVVPRQIVVVKPGLLPRTSSGKKRRSMARQLYESGAFDVA